MCTHDQRVAIDRLLVAGGSERSIADRYDLSRSALNRHRSKHLARAVARSDRAAFTADVKRGAKLTDRTEALYDGMLARLESIAVGEDPKGAASLAREVRGSLELWARMRGELAPAGATVNVLVDARGRPREEWAAVLRAVLSALRPYPEAARAVLAELATLDAGAGAGVVGMVEGT